MQVSLTTTVLEFSIGMSHDTSLVEIRHPLKWGLDSHGYHASCDPTSHGRRRLSRPSLKLLHRWPPARSPTVGRIWGAIHAGLYHLSERYCSWFDIPFNPNVLDLPFGLVLKWTERATLKEAVSMQMARAAGMPVLKALCCGDHLGNPVNRTFSILMTRLPGMSFVNSADALAVEAEEP